MAGHKLFIALVICIFAGSSNAATVAILDTGVNPVGNLAPFVEQPGFNAIDGSSDTTDRVGHGTVVAAYAVRASEETATVLPVKVSVGNVIPLTAAVRGVNFASVQPRVRVLNISFGGGPFDRDSFTALAAAVNRGKLVVMAAGNDGAPGPVQGAKAARLLQGGAIAVGAIDNNDVIRPYSNRAGDNQNVYLVARDDPFNLNILGTSFSAPIVSGIAARIFDHSPHLTGREVASILFTTAIDLGAPGVDRIYGRGRVNAAAALAPVGTTGVPLGLRTSGPLASLDERGIGVGRAVGAALAENSRLLGRVLILDAYERGFHADLRPALLDRATASRVPDFFASLERRFGAVDVGTVPGVSLRMWPRPLASDRGPFDRWSRSGPSRRAPPPALSLAGEPGDRIRYHLALNRPPGAALAQPLPDTARFVGLSSGAPFAGFGDRAHFADVSVAVSDGMDLSFASVLTRESGAYRRDSLAGLLKGVWRVNDRASVMLQVGHLREDGSLLGGSSSGAFSVAETRSLSVLVGGRWRLGGKASLFGYYGQAMSRPDTSGLSLIEDVSTLRSQAFGAGLTYQGLISESDRFGVAITRPLRVIDGFADLSVPQSRDIAGNTSVQRERVSLVPEAAQTDLETYYYFDARDNLRVGGHLLYTLNPSHSTRLSDTAAVFVTVSGSF